jgi:hypothetical protein
MTWLKRKSDPISQREKALAAEIAALESQIKRLDSRLQREQAKPVAATHAIPPTRRTSSAVDEAPAEMVIEGSSRAVHNRSQSLSTPQHYNDLGVRKYDLVALWERVRSWFSGPAPANPQLLKMLAAGNIEGLRPLRIEKRKARRRFLVLAAVLFLVLLGIISVFIRHG